MEAQRQDKHSEKQVLYIFVRIALGLKDIHNQHIVHRDIKHKNILLSDSSKRPRVKITDFGLASYLEEHECVTQPVGTHGYKAPEIILNEPADFKSDIWSLGCILYELLCGDMPFLGSSIEAIEERIVNQQLTFNGPKWSNVSEASIDLVKNMLCKNHEARYDIADVLLHPWVI